MTDNFKQENAADEGKLRETISVLYSMIDEGIATLPQDSAARIRAIFEFRKSLLNETDRGAVLMAAAFMDDQLKAMLMARLVDDKKMVHRAFDFNGPLGTFSSRIDFSYLLGILPKNAQRDLHIIRKIRNIFAHSAAPLTYDDDSVKPLCDSLAFHGVRPAASAGSKFRRTAMGLLTFITIEIDKSTHLAAREDYLIPDRSDAYQLVSKIYENINGEPYPLKHEHEG